MEAIDAIKPGMTRADLLTVFTVESGISTRARRTYVYRLCPYIKVEVDFTPVTNPDDRLTEMSDDKILKLSRPYLQYSVTD
jgi:putative aminopeptidase FrvX